MESKARRWPRTGRFAGAQASTVTVHFAEHPVGLFAVRP
jgi:hypothetical protein